MFTNAESSLLLSVKKYVMFKRKHTFYLIKLFHYNMIVLKSFIKSLHFPDIEFGEVKTYLKKSYFVFVLLFPLTINHLKRINFNIALKNKEEYKINEISERYDSYSLNVPHPISYDSKTFK